MLKKTIFGVGICFFVIQLAGCSSEPKIHKWQLLGNDRSVVLSTSEWPVLETEFYHRVNDEMLEKAITLLSEESYYMLSKEEENNFWKGLPVDDNYVPYLVRGVAYGGVPAYTILRFDEQYGELVVYHATYNGENILFTSMVDEPVECPLIVYLPKPLNKVYPTANLGGDIIFRRGDLEKIDTR